MRFFDFEGHQISSVFKGNWQLAGGHGAISKEQAIADLFAYTEHGINVFDVGDIYTGAEELLGAFLEQAYAKGVDNKTEQRLRVHTKFVPDLNALEDLTRQDVRRIITRSLKRLGLERLHLVQFHWWDFSKGDFVQAARYLVELQEEGLIESIGLTNFDCAHLRQLLDAGVPVKSNQIQFSLLDPRPLNGMLELAQQRGIHLFCYGVLAGGLLGNARPGDEPANRSHIKYGLVIDEAGKAYYEEVTRTLAALATAHHSTPANIAAGFALQTPGVSSVILGPRNTKHIHELDALASLQLDKDEYQQLRNLLEQQQAGNRDDIYSYERIFTSPHGQIMKYNLNNMRPERA